MTAIAQPPRAYPCVRDVLGADIHRARAFALPLGCTGYAARQPGVTYSASTHAAIYAALVPVTTASFGADMTSYWQIRREGNYFGNLAEFILVADRDDQMVGWTGYSVLDRGAYVNLYVDSTGMAPTGQSRGVMREVLRSRIMGAAYQDHQTRESVYLSARSENPIFYKLMCALLGDGNVYPSPRAALPDDIRACAIDLARWLGQEHILDPDTLAIRGAYSMIDELYGELPSTGDAELDAFFRKQLGPLDAYLLLGRIGGAGDAPAR